MSIRVIMADDHELIRQGMTHLLGKEPDIALVATVNDGVSLLQYLRKKAVDVVLMDMNMPGRNGLELLKQIKQEHPATPVVILSTYNEEMYAVRAIKAGASAYLCKDDATGNLVSAIRQVASGQVFITPGVATLMTDVLQHRNVDGSQLVSLLSDREHEVLLMLATGKTVTEVGDHLCLSTKTISTYKARIKLKLGLNSSADIVRFAIENNLLE